MKILHIVALGFRGGGAECYVDEIRAQFRSRGHRVRVLSSDRLYGDNELFSDATFSYPPRTGMGRAVVDLLNVPAYTAVRQELRNFSPDIVHIHTLAEASPTILLALRNVPTILTIHGPESFLLSLIRWLIPSNRYRDAEFTALSASGMIQFGYHAYMQRPFYLMGLRNVDLAIAPSKYIASLARSELKIPVAQLYNGIKLSPRGSMTLGEEILYVGGVKDVKGVKHLIDAMSFVNARIPTATLRIVGDGSARPGLQEAVERKGLTDRVKFEGFVSDGKLLQTYYDNCAVVAVPSVWPDNLPTVVMEAMDRGRPVVGSRVGGIPELVKEGETGLLVPPADPKALGAALVEILSNPGRAQWMGQRARDFVESTFDINNHVERLQEQYDRVLQNQRGKLP